MDSYVRAAGVRLAAVGEAWAAFSAASGETHLINAESVLVLECLSEHQPLDSGQVAQAIAGELGSSASEIDPVLANCWPLLIEAGLVRVAAPASRDP